MKIVLTIAGSDSSGAAGLQADLSAISASGGVGATAVTSITAQNCAAVSRIQHLSPSLVCAQLDSIFAGSSVAAVKTGMLGAPLVALRVAGMLAARPALPVVVDPVLVSTSGRRLTSPATRRIMVERLFPLATLVTPNRAEARALTGVDPCTPERAVEAGRRLLRLGCRAALVKGGHLDGDPADVLVHLEGVRVFNGSRLEAAGARGTGCTLASAIATRLAQGHPLERAIELARELVRQRLGGRPRIGRLHVLTDEVLQHRYTHLELARLALLGGADAIQVREKRPGPARALIDACSRIAGLCAESGGSCIVDDRADVALAAGAHGVHVGREDLPPAWARELLGDRRLVGGTANSLEEARVRFTQSLDYLGVGPVFGTRSKANPAPELGLEILSAIAAESPVPVIAIGNITPERVAAVRAAGAHGVAVLSGVALAADPRRAAAEYAEALR